MNFRSFRCGRERGRRRMSPPAVERLEPRLLLSGVNEAVWIEGEDYVQPDDYEEHWGGASWYHGTGIDTSLLSGGDWHSHYLHHADALGGETHVRASYAFEVDNAGSFDWWIRVNPFHNHRGGGHYAWRLDGGEWSDLDVSEVTSRIDLVDPGIDIRFIGWTWGATLDLSPGEHTLQVRIVGLPGETEVHGGIDCMAMTNYPWAPTGIVPPDPDAPPPGPGDWFALMARPDSFSDASVTDVSHLLEDQAGSHGALQRQGDEFVFADGTPARFWGVDGHPTDTPESRARQARWWAKNGINMVRLHTVEGLLGPLEGTPGNRSFDPDNLDTLDHWFAQLKDNGIYTTWSLFYHPVLTAEDGIDPDLWDELPDRSGGKDAYGYATFIDEYQDSMWEYARTLLEHVNPYTGLAYKDDPALAIVEMRNEDSVFFHNPLGDSFVRGLSARHHHARLAEDWRAWVADRYATDDALAEAWGDGLRTSTTYNNDGSVRSYPDSVDESRMYIYAAWEMTADGPHWRNPAERARLGDFIRFLAEMQREDYQTYRDRLRAEGFDGVVVSTAWQAGGAAAQAANLWTDDAMDAIDRHNYFGGGAGGHSITPGEVHNGTHLDQPGSGIPSQGLWQVEDKPFIMTEWTQKPPNQWKAEIAPIMAFYGMGLQGWDAVYHFAADKSHMGGGWPDLSSYATETPHYIGQFPALAFAVHNGHFDQGDLVAARRVGLDDAFSGIDVLSQDFTGGGWDENEPNGDLDTPMETLAIGRVTLKVADGLDHSFAADWSTWWDPDAQTVLSNTGQLAWDYGDRVILARSDKTQGLVGFAGGGSYELPDVSVDVTTEFVSLLLTPMDNQAMYASRNVLVTAMARDQQYQAQYNDDGTYLHDVGSEPLMLQPVQARLSFRGAPITSVTPLDLLGVPGSGEVPVTDDAFDIDGRYATYYYHVTRAEQGDADANGVVDVTDLAILAANWQTADSQWHAGDFDGDRTVDVTDLAILAAHWGNGKGAGDERGQAATLTDTSTQPTVALAAKGSADDGSTPRPTCDATLGVLSHVAVRDGGEREDSTRDPLDIPLPLTRRATQRKAHRLGRASSPSPQLGGLPLGPRARTTEARGQLVLHPDRATPTPDDSPPAQLDASWDPFDPAASLDALAAFDRAEPFPDLLR